MYLLDTCVLSDLGPSQTSPDPAIRAWLRQHGERCSLSVVSMTEIAYGIAWLRHRGAAARASRLQSWYHEIANFHAERIFPIDLDIAARGGVLMARARAAGYEPSAEDAWIAATAEVHGLEVLTFNMSDFGPMAVTCRNPLTDLPTG